MTDEQRKAKKEYMKRWNMENAEAIRQQKHDYYMSHKEEFKERQRRWISNNPDKFNAEPSRIKSVDNQIAYLVKWIDRVETLDHYLDGISEDAATQEILHLAERRYA